MDPKCWYKYGKGSDFALEDWVVSETFYEKWIVGKEIMTRYGSGVVGVKNESILGVVGVSDYIKSRQYLEFDKGAKYNRCSLGVGGVVNDTAVEGRSCCLSLQHLNSAPYTLRVDCLEEDEEKISPMLLTEVGAIPIVSVSSEIVGCNKTYYLLSPPMLGVQPFIAFIVKGELVGGVVVKVTCPAYTYSIRDEVVVMMTNNVDKIKKRWYRSAVMGELLAKRNGYGLIY